MCSFSFLLFTYFVEAVIVCLYAKSLYAPKRNNFVSFLVSVLWYCVVLLPLKCIYENEVVNVIAICISIFFIFTFLYHSSIKSALFHSAILAVSQFISEFSIAYITSALFHISTAEAIQAYFEVSTIAWLLLYFLISRLLIIFSAKENDSHSWGKWCSLSVLPIGSIVVLISYRAITANIKLTSFENSLIIAVSSLLLLINIIIYFIYEKSEKNNQKLLELEIVHQKNDIDLAYLTLLEKKNEQMRIMAHDYKNNLLNIAAMSDSDEIKNYVKDMVGEVSRCSYVGKAKNRILDVILSKYMDMCKALDIHFDAGIITDDLAFLTAQDTSALFNNLLDNAVEAAQKSTDKKIYLQISKVKNTYHRIIVENSAEQTPKSKNGNLISNKADKHLHGYGTKSIRQTVKKYNGELHWEYDENEKIFKIIILLPVEG